MGNITRENKKNLSSCSRVIIGQARARRDVRWAMSRISIERTQTQRVISIICVCMCVCVCVCSHQARRVIFVSDVVSDEGRNNSTRKIHQLF